MQPNKVPFHVDIRVSPPAREGQEPHEETHRLRVDRTFGRVGAEGPGDPPWASFATSGSNTPMQRVLVTRACHDLLGPRAWLDLQRDVESLHQELLRQVDERLWPEGRPERLTAEQQEAFAAAWEALRTPEVGLYSLARAQVDRLEFLALWRVVVAAPPGWEDLAELDIDEPTLLAIHRAFDAAREGARGKKR